MEIKNKNYKTEQEAHDELENNNLEYMKWSAQFCPIAQQKCDTNCACWVDPWIKDGSKVYPKFDGFSISYGYCSSPLITGEIYINNMP